MRGLGKDLRTRPRRSQHNSAAPDNADEQDPGPHRRKASITDMNTQTVPTAEQTLRAIHYIVNKTTHMAAADKLRAVQEALAEHFDRSNS